MKINSCHSVLFLAALVLACCCCKTRQVGVEVNRDQRTEIRYEYIKTHDTVLVSIPYEVVRDITRDTVSKLHTSVAFSIASIDTLGMLHHTLMNNSETGLSATIDNVIQVRDSIVYVDSSRVETRIVTKEKDLNGWHRFQMYGFWICLLIILVLLVWIFRKPLMKIIRLCIGAI